MGKTGLDIFIVAGEASGDNHSAKLVRELRKLAPNATFFGSAGPRMREAGVDAIVKADELSVVGLAEIGAALPMFVRTMRTLKGAVKKRRPDMAVLVDFPEFNLKLARPLKNQGIPVVYYISPQLWAWRQYRISTIRQHVDLLLTILPFEKGWYADRGVSHVEYVGSPLVREVQATASKDEFLRKHGLMKGKPLVALLPGSRSKEISQILPDLLRAARLMPKVQFVLAVNRGLGKNCQLPSNTVCVRDETYNALAAADAAAVTSGTATLEAGILGTPMIVVYKTSKLNYALFEPMIDIPHYGLINLIAEKRIATELIQQDLTPERVRDEIQKLLAAKANSNKRAELAAATAKLGSGGASKRAAQAILKLVQS